MSGELSMPRILACGYRLEKKETPLPEGGTFCSVELRGAHSIPLFQRFQSQITTL